MKPMYFTTRNWKYSCFDFLLSGTRNIARIFNASKGLCFLVFIINKRQFLKLQDFGSGFLNFPRNFNCIYYRTISWKKWIACRFWQDIFTTWFRISVGKNLLARIQNANMDLTATQLVSKFSREICMHENTFF